MVNILIVEDQKLIQKDLVIKVQKISSEYNVVGTALNGKEALEIIKNQKVDVIITDIKMPVMTGLELLEKVQEVKLKKIILSGFQEFDYAKQALKLGVDEYLLKPVLTEELKLALEMVTQDMFHAEKELMSAYITNIYKQQKSDIMKPTNLTYKQCMLIMMMKDAYPFFDINFNDKKSLEEISSEIVELLEEELKVGDIYVTPGKYGNEVIYTVVNDEIDRAGVRLGLERYLKQAEATLTIQLGDVLTDVEGLLIESQLKRMYLKENLRFANSTLLTDFKRDNTIKNMVSRSLKKKIFEASKSKNDAVFFVELQSLLDRLEDNKATQNQVAFAVKAFFCEVTGGKEAYESRNIEIEEAISFSKTYSELREFLFSMVRMERCLPEENNVENLVFQIKSYIDEKFASSIDISMVAAEFKITPTYLGRVFKKYVGVTPNVYLTRVRITTAKKYLVESSLKVCEISDLCGYTDPLYFSKKFKKITSKTPSEYRVTFS